MCNIEKNYDVYYDGEYLGVIKSTKEEIKEDILYFLENYNNSKIDEELIYYKEQK